MKTLFNTKKTIISVDNEGNLFTNLDKPVGLTLGQLKAYKDKGVVLGFPFNKINIDDVKISENLPLTIFKCKGANFNKYDDNELEQFREEHEISNVLSLVKFIDLNLEVISEGLIFTLHNGVMFSKIIENNITFKKFLKTHLETKKVFMQVLKKDVVEHKYIKVFKKTSIHKGMHVMECPICGKILASTAEREWLPQFMTCNGLK